MRQKPCEHCSVLWASHCWLLTEDPQVVDPKNVRPQIPHLRARDPRSLSEVSFVTGALRKQPSHSLSSHTFSSIISLFERLVHSYEYLRFSEKFINHNVMQV